MVKYETHEAKISEILNFYISNLGDGQGWKILAIDLFTDTLVLKREIPEKVTKKPKK